MIWLCFWVLSRSRRGGYSSKEHGIDLFGDDEAHYAQLSDTTVTSCKRLRGLAGESGTHRRQLLHKGRPACETTRFGALAQLCARVSFSGVIIRVMGDDKRSKGSEKSVNNHAKALDKLDEGAGSQLQNVRVQTFVRACLQVIELQGLCSHGRFCTR